MNLETKNSNVDLGWNSFFEQSFEQYKNQNYVAMRIIRENRGKYIACNETGEFLCEITGKFRFDNESRNNFPIVGDWVVTSVVPNERKAMISSVLPRKSMFSRKVSGEITEEQPIAANIDTVFIITGLDLNYNLRRIERFLSIVVDSGALPVIFLNKSDLCPEYEKRKSEVEAIAKGVDVHTISAYNQEDLGKLKQYIKTGETVAFLGSSGVGKSTIINALLNKEQLKTNEVSEFGSRGRHTTTFRELIVLPDGGMVVDTPGMREIQVWGDEKGLEKVFDDIEDLAVNCRFRDCSHKNEPGCSVLEAVQKGTLDKKRYESYLKLQKEYEYLEARQTMKANAVEKIRWKVITKSVKQLKKNRNY
ncbi:MAG: ribosome small subunit-dependent GTPase A [Endomicrobiaceae bacterium]